MTMPLKHMTVPEKTVDKLQTIQRRRGCTLRQAVILCVDMAYDEIFYSNRSTTPTELRSMLREHGIKQKDVAERVGVSSGAVSMAVSGRVRSENIATAIKKMVEERKNGD